MQCRGGAVAQAERGADHIRGWALTLSEPHTRAASYDRLLWTDGRSLTVARSSRDLSAFEVVFHDLARFEVDLGRRAVAVARLTDISDATLRHLLVDQVLPRLIAHDGSLVLHAAGIDVGGEATLLLGLSGRGKSTLAASFHVSGHALLGDDAMIIAAGEGESRARCRSLYRSLRLFPDSVAGVFSGPRANSPVADYTAKQNIIDLEEPEASQPDLPVRSIYWLGDSSSDRIGMRRLAPAEACMTLVEHSFSLDPSDTDRSKVRLGHAAALAAAVPVLEIAYRRDYAILADLREAILAGQADG